MAPPVIRGGAHGVVLALQRQIGNRATGRVLARDPPRYHRLPAPASLPQLPPGVHRVTPFGLTPAQWRPVVALLRARLGGLGGQIVLQGSRVTGRSFSTGQPPNPFSDFDFGVRVDDRTFDSLFMRAFGLNRRNNQAETAQYAHANGQISTRPAGLTGARREIAQALGVSDSRVALTIVRIGGRLDRGPVIEIAATGPVQPPSAPIQLGPGVLPPGRGRGRVRSGSVPGGGRRGASASAIPPRVADPPSEEAPTPPRPVPTSGRPTTLPASDITPPEPIAPTPRPIPTASRPTTLPASDITPPEPIAPGPSRTGLGSGAAWVIGNEFFEWMGGWVANLYIANDDALQARWTLERREAERRAWEQIARDAVARASRLPSHGERFARVQVHVTHLAYEDSYEIEHVMLSNSNPRPTPEVRITDSLLHHIAVGILSGGTNPSEGRLTVTIPLPGPSETAD